MVVPIGGSEAWEAMRLELRKSRTEVGARAADTLVVAGLGPPRSLARKEEGSARASPPVMDGKRRRLEGAELGVGVREAIREEIVMGRKEVRFGVVSAGTPYWEWAVPVGGVLCWIWGSDLGEHNRNRFGQDMWPAEATGLDKMTPVDVVLFEGPGPRPTHGIWSLDIASLNTIVWFDRNC